MIRYPYTVDVPVAAKGKYFLLADCPFYLCLLTEKDYDGRALGEINFLTGEYDIYFGSALAEALKAGKFKEKPPMGSYFVVPAHHSRVLSGHISNKYEYKQTKYHESAPRDRSISNLVSVRAALQHIGWGMGYITYVSHTVDVTQNALAFVEGLPKFQGRSTKHSQAETLLSRWNNKFGSMNLAFERTVGWSCGHWFDMDAEVSRYGATMSTMFDRIAGGMRMYTGDVGRGMPIEFVKIAGNGAQHLNEYDPWEIKTETYSNDFKKNWHDVLTFPTGSSLAINLAIPRHRKFISNGNLVRNIIGATTATSLNHLDEIRVKLMEKGHAFQTYSLVQSVGEVRATVEQVLAEWEVNGGDSADFDFSATNAQTLEEQHKDVAKYQGKPIFDMVPYQCRNIGLPALLWFLCKSVSPKYGTMNELQKVLPCHWEEQQRLDLLQEFTEGFE